MIEKKGSTFDTRDAIMNTALGLFASRGYDGVGTQEIVSQSGVTKPVLYHHFGSKQGLLEALLLKYGTTYVECLEVQAVYLGDIVGNLQNITRGIVDFARTNPLYFRFAAALEVGAPESPGYLAFLPIKQRVYSILEHLFILASRDHGNMIGRQVLYSRSFLGTVQTWALLIINDEITLEEHDMYRIVHQFNHGIFS